MIDPKPEGPPMAAVIDRFFGVVSLSIPAGLLRAWVMWLLWGWYAPADWPALPFRGAALVWLLWLLWGRGHPNTDDLPFRGLIVRAATFPLTVLALGWMVSWVVR